MDTLNVLRVNKKKVLFYAVLVITALCSFAAFQILKHKVYPEILIDMKIDSKQARSMSENFLTEMGIDHAKYKKVTTFSSSSDDENFLDKSVGAQKAGELLNDQISSWVFDTRFFIPSEQEEYWVSFDNQGRFSYYSYAIPEGKEGAKLEEADAQAIAEAFIRKYSHEDLGQYELAEKDFNNREKRIDHSFTWENKNFDLNGAKKRMMVDVVGDQIGYFNTYLKIPEEWSRNETRVYSHNTTAQTVAQLAVLLLINIPMIVLFVLQFKKKQFNYRFSFFLAAIVGMVSLLVLVDSLPTIYSGYDTLDSWPNFLAKQAFGFLIAPIMAGFSTWLMVLVCESYFRQANPDKPSLHDIITRNFFKRKEYPTALLVGFLCGFIVIAYQMFYYFLVEKFGFWVPSDVVGFDAYTGYLPWINIFVIGLLPALSEEFVFRLFGISFLSKILKKTWIAVALTSLMWAFLHSAYPQQPFFARGLELFPVGIVFSILFLRFGILSSISAHFTMNALLTLQYLLKSSPIDQGISILMFLLPALLALALYLLQRRKNISEPIAVQTNAEYSEILEKNKIDKTDEKPRHLDLLPLSNRASYIAISFIIIGLLASFFLDKYEPKPVLPELPDGKSRNEIMQIADRQMLEKGIDPQQYKKVTSLSVNFGDTDKEYLLSQPDGIESLKTIYDKIIPAYLWKVRYFKPMEKEGNYIFLLTDGEVYSFDHIMPENKKGAVLSKDEAKILAQNYLQSRKDVNIADLEFLEITENKKEARMDHLVIYKDKAFDLGDGSIRASVALRGDEVVDFSKYVEIPEDWYRDRAKSNMKDFIIGVISFILSTCFIICFIVSFLRLYRNGSLKILQGYKFALPLLVVILIQGINELTTYYADYAGIENITLFHTKSIITYVVLGLVAFLLSGLMYAFALALIRENVSSPILPKDKDQKKWAYKDAIIMAYALIVSLVFVYFIGILIKQFLEKKYDFYAYWITLPELPSSLNHFFPIVSQLGDIALILFCLPLIFIPILVIYRYLKNWWFVWAFFLFVMALSIAMQNGYRMMLIESLRVVPIYFLIVPIAFFIRRNFLSLLVVTFMLAFANSIDLWKNDLLAQAMEVIGLIIPILIYLFYFGYIQNWTKAFLQRIRPQVK